MGEIIATKHVELIAIINKKLVIVAFSWLFILINYTGGKPEAENVTPKQTKITFAVERVLCILACHYRIKYLQFSHCLSTR